MQIECKGLLFDLDGVLIDSTANVERHWRAWMSKVGLDPATSLQPIHGRRAMDSIRMLKPDADVDAEYAWILAAESGDTSGITALAGARELLASLPPERWAVVTSGAKMLARRRLAAAGLPEPLHLVGADSVQRGKPHPEPYATGASLLGLPPDECVVLEDVPAGIQAGNAAGCRCIGVLGIHPPEHLSAALAVVAGVRQVRCEAHAEGLRLSLNLDAG